jgi:hypothetical protein
MTSATTITVICSYCGRVIRTIDGQGVEGESHGICELCFPKVRAEIRKFFGERNEPGRTSL